jgi:membrane protease subunit (stomatin/prohibitin family)
VIAGTATHVSANVAHRQSEKFAAQDQAAAASQESAPHQASDQDAISQLKQWADLKDKGIITQEDFDIKKKELLGT